MWDAQAELLVPQLGMPQRHQIGQKYLGLVATHGKSMSQWSQGTLRHNARSIHYARCEITQLGVVVGNWWCNSPAAGFTAEFPTSDVATITLAVEYPLGATPIPLTFNLQPSITLADYSMAKTDLLPIRIPNGAKFAIREYRVCGTNGGVINTGGNNYMNINSGDGNCYETGNAISSRVGTPGAFASTGFPYYYPLAVIGLTDQPSYAIIGDSRAEGFMDDGSATNTFAGEYAACVGPKRAYMNLARAADSLNGVFVKQGFMAHRGALIRMFATDILSNYGINDCGNDSEWVIHDYWMKLRAMFPNQYFYQTTLDTTTSSTDNWATETNQTPLNDAMNKTARPWLNNLARAGFMGGRGGIDSIIDSASITESSTTVGLWKANYTLDGNHPSRAAITAVVNSGVVKVR